MERNIRVQADLPFINRNIKWKVSSVFKHVDPKLPVPVQPNVRSWIPDNGDTEYMLIQPNIGITISIYSSTFDGEKGYVQSIYMGYDRIILFQHEIERMIKGFYEIENLFYIEKDKTGLSMLYVNAELSLKYERLFQTSGKTVKLKYAIVPDDEDRLSSYEGIVMFINSYDVYAMITKNELERMLYTLQHTDFINLSFHLLESVPIFKNN